MKLFFKETVSIVSLHSSISLISSSQSFEFGILFNLEKSSFAKIFALSFNTRFLNGMFPSWELFAMLEELDFVAGQMFLSKEFAKKIEFLSFYGYTFMAFCSIGEIVPTKLANSINMNFFILFTI